VYFGQELKWPGFAGGWTIGTDLFETATTLFAPYINGTILNPTTFNTGQYDIRGYTYGYIQNKAFSVSADLGQIADIKLNLIVGVNVTLDILFKKESIITPTAENMSARVRLFDDAGNLVAEWMSSEGTYTPQNGIAVAADGTNQFPHGGVLEGGSGGAIQPRPVHLNTYNFLPGGVTQLHVLMAGLPELPASGQGAYWATPKGGFSGWGVIESGYLGPYFGDPIFTHNLYAASAGKYTCDFGVDCYGPPGPGYTPAIQYFPNSGILGYPDYTGGWTAEVDFVNLYKNNTVTTTASCYTGTVSACGGQYYPPVQGLLMGESYHIIPGTTAKSGISFTEDAALNPGYLGHSMAPNHLGPYSQQGVWLISNAHESGEASAVFEVDLNGFVSGNALAFTWSNEFRPLSWGLVTVTGASGASWNFYTYDGIYEAYVTPGTYKFTISSPGYATQSWSVSVNPGQNGQGQNLYLEQSNIPVPEFNGILIVTISTLGAALILRRRRQR